MAGDRCGGHSRSLRVLRRRVHFRLLGRALSARERFGCRTMFGGSVGGGVAGRVVGPIDGVCGDYPQQHQAKVVRQSSRGRVSRKSFMRTHSIQASAGNVRGLQGSVCCDCVNFQRIFVYPNSGAGALRSVAERKGGQCRRGKSLKINDLKKLWIFKCLSAFIYVFSKNNLLQNVPTRYYSSAFTYHGLCIFSPKCPSAAWAFFCL